MELFAYALFGFLTGWLLVTIICKWYRAWKAKRKPHRHTAISPSFTILVDGYGKYRVQPFAKGDSNKWIRWNLYLNSITFDNMAQAMAAIDEYLEVKQKRVARVVCQYP